MAGKCGTDLTEGLPEEEAAEAEASHSHDPSARRCKDDGAGTDVSSKIRARVNLKADVADAKSVKTEPLDGQDQKQVRTEEQENQQDSKTEDRAKMAPAVSAVAGTEADAGREGGVLMQCSKSNFQTIASASAIAQLPTVQSFKTDSLFFK